MYSNFSKPQKKKGALLACVVAVGICLLAAQSVRGDFITIANAGFENPVLADNSFTNNSIPGWTGTDSGATANFGVYNPMTSVFPSIPGGQNIAYIERGEIFQTLSDTLAAGDYSLTVQVGDSLVDPVSPFTVQLRAGSSVLGQTSSPVPANGTFTLVTVNYTAGAGNPLLGQALQIRFIDNDASKTTEPYFDNVQLSFNSAAVPEPSSLVLCALGSACAAVAGWRRRRRQLTDAPLAK